MSATLLVESVRSAHVELSDALEALGRRPQPVPPRQSTRMDNDSTVLIGQIALIAKKLQEFRGPDRTPANAKQADRLADDIDRIHGRIRQVASRLGIGGSGGGADG